MEWILDLVKRLKSQNCYDLFSENFGACQGEIANKNVELDIVTDVDFGASFLTVMD